LDSEEDHNEMVEDVCLVQDQELCFDDPIPVETNKDQDKTLEQGIHIDQDQTTSTYTPNQPNQDIAIATPSCSNSSHLCQVNPTCEPSLVNTTCNPETRINTDSTSLKTQLGKAVEVVLGPIKDVFKFDSSRAIFKRNTKSKDAVKGYESQLALIQTKVLAKEREIKKCLNEWEKQFFLKFNCRIPTLDEMKKDKTASKYLKQLKYSEALLKEWKISL